MKKQRITGILGGVFNALYTLLMLFLLLVAANALIGTLGNTQPRVFGYAVSEILSSSMEASGFNKGDYVVTKSVTGASELEVGNIVAFYANSDRSPILPGDDRSDCVVVFHEIIAINGDGEFITKGSSNSKADPYPIPFGAVAGKYVENAGAFTELIIGALLIRNRYMYWILSALALIALIQLVKFTKSFGGVRLQWDVINGKRSLLDKECFKKNIFNEFSKKDKDKLIIEAPAGLAMLYEYLLYKRLSPLSGDAADKLEGKRCNLGDVLFLTLAGERDNEIDTDIYVRALPPKDKKLDNCGDVEQFKKQSASDIRQLISVLLGCLLFTVIYFIIAFTVRSLPVTAWYEIALAAALPVIMLFIALLTLIANKRTAKKLAIYTAFSATLPPRYRYMLQPENYTESEIINNIIHIQSKFYSNRI